MAQRKSTTGAAAPDQQQVDPAQVQAAGHGMLTQVAATGALALSGFAQMQQLRAARLADTAAALGTQLGKNDPALAAAKAVAQSSADVQVHMAAQATRLQNLPRIHPNEWVVFGTVTDASGAPVSSLTVRVFDRDRKFDDLLGETETDAGGNFSVIYHERDFKETGENLPDLYLMIADASGKTVYSSRDSVRYEAGRSEFFAVQLGTGKAKARRKKSE